MKNKTTKTTTKTKVMVNSTIMLGIVSAVCVGVAFLALAVSFGQKLLLMLR